jgi:predicted DNA binding protein
MPTTIADITVPGHVFAIGNVLTEHPNIYIELERLVPLGDRLLPFFWISDGSVEHIEAALASEPVVDSVTHLSEVGDEHLYQVSWTKQQDGLVDVLLETDGAILEGNGISGQWELRVRFPDHESFRAFNERCTESGIEVELRGVYNPHVPTVEQHLTPTQWRTLAVAYERGYFDVPRRTKLESLADHFGISEQAVSQRLRRGTGALVDWVMFSSSDPTGE